MMWRRGRKAERSTTYENGALARSNVISVAIMHPPTVFPSFTKQAVRDCAEAKLSALSLWLSSTAGPVASAPRRLPVRFLQLHTERHYDWNGLSHASAASNCCANSGVMAAPPGYCLSVRTAIMICVE